MNPIGADIQEARRQLTEILSDPEFGGNSKNVEAPDISLQPGTPKQTSFFSQWNGEFPQEVLFALYIFLGVFVAVILIWVIRNWWIQRSLKNSVKRKKKPQEQPHWLDQAKTLAQQGEYRFAIRALFHYLLEFTSKQKKIFLQIDKTNGEYQQEVRERWPANAKPFGQLTNQFDEIWYGEKHATENEFTLYQRKIMEFVEKGGQDEKR